ncbi:hypothetical protein KCP70_02885 [Salmonella enterica subsp. enterica]|nr:hypothetical protein KCP70_02885 [Salmonella enterica subsp. enterica]
MAAYAAAAPAMARSPGLFAGWRVLVTDAVMFGLLRQLSRTADRFCWLRTCIRKLERGNILRAHLCCGRNGSTARGAMILRLSPTALWWREALEAARQRARWSRKVATPRSLICSP